MQHNYLQFLFELGNFGIKLGLENISTILQKLGNPHYHNGIIHCAGTNGKGSTLITLERLLINSGYRVGCTISPHLISFNERFRYQGNPISNQELESLFLEICKVCGIHPDHFSVKKEWQIIPTFFEFSICIAFLWFQKKKVDFILLETGLGGRLDATNVIPKPLACILTPISYDHQEYLGHRLESITFEKLGIVKNKAPVFCSKQVPEVYEQILKYCKENKNLLFYYENQFGYQKEKSLDHVFYIHLQHCLKTIPIKELALHGDIQWENTATALAAYFYLIPVSKQLDQQNIQTALKGIKWLGRFQYLKNKPTILLDGAHNESAMHELANYLKKYHIQDKILIAISWMKEKKMENIFSEFASLNITFQPINYGETRALDANIIEKQLQSNTFLVLPPITLDQLENKIKTSTKFSLIVITGSLFLIGAFLKTKLAQKILH